MGCLIDKSQKKNGDLQGSVLGLSLFNLYTNDLPGFLDDKAEIVMFADDCAVVISDRNRKKTRGEGSSDSCLSE